MPAADDCCYRCDQCGDLTCGINECCANFTYFADPCRYLCGQCAKDET